MYRAKLHEHVKLYQMCAVLREYPSFPTRRSSDLGSGSVPAAEALLAETDERWREAEAEAARRRARVDALDLALGEARAGTGAEVLADLEGAAGPLADHVEIDPGTEAAVAAGLGEALQAVVLDGGDAARRALERVKAGDARALVVIADALPAGARAPSAVPVGARLLGECVHARRPGLDAVRARRLPGIVLVEGGWREIGRAHV